MSVISSELSEQPTTVARSTGFCVESGAVMQRLRTSVSEMLKTIPSRVRTTRDLQKVFGVDVKLCWQMLKLTGPGDALSLAPFVPTPGPMKRFLAAAKSAGIDRQVIDRINAAYDAFNEQVQIHAGDRPTFEAMVTGAAGINENSSEDLQKQAIRLRKSAFQTVSHYAGVQLETYVGASFIHPSADPRLLDAANLRVRLGVRRLRANAGLTVDQIKNVNSEAIVGEQDNFTKGVFDEAAAAQYGAPLLPQFCSNPLPKFITKTESDGRCYTCVAGDTVGQTSAVDLVFGRTVSNAPYTEFFSGTKRGFGSSIDITAPMALLILDKLVHRPSFAKVELDFTVQWQDNPAFPTSPDNISYLPFNERLTKLDAGVDGARMHEVPRYIEMLEFVCQHRNWRIEDFDVYRVRIEYPLHATRIWTRFFV
jgi:hypothetical protein